MKHLRTAKYSLFLLLFCCCTLTVLAQEKTITGKVVSDDGPPLPGVSVSVKGAKNSVTTDADGKFSITVPGNDAVLSVSHIGFLSKDVAVGTNGTVNVTLFKTDKSMEDVVVVGYGAKKRANVLGSVGTINPKEIEDLPVANLATALVNKVPGVSIAQASGKPGATTNLRIRNPITFGSTGSINPLYVIDGIAYNDPDGKTFFDNLDATMVESISFLKDAAASIYGSRGANGVVLVTTKKGKPGKPRISYSGSYGVSTAADMPETLTALEHVALLNNKYKARPAWNNLVYSQQEIDHVRNNNNDWLNATWQNAYLQRHTINVSGGSDRITYFAGANYLKETGNLKDLYATRYGFRIGMNAKISDDITADVVFSNDYADQDRPTPDGIAAFAGQNSDQTDEMNATMGALLLIPRWVPLYINNKPVFTTAPGWHPLEVQGTNTYARTNSRGQNITASINYKIPYIDGLTFRASYGLNSRNVAGKEYSVPYNLYDFARTNYSPLTGTGVTKQAVIFTDVPTASNPIRAIRNGNSLRLSSDASKSYQFNQSLNYKKTFGNHDIDVLVLAEQSESSTENFFTSAETQVIPGVDELWGFSSDRATYDHISRTTETGRASFLGRLNYSFMDRYLLEATFRADASPNFPPESRWGYFPSVAVGWKISEEDFFRNIHFVDNLKLRFQVGLTGSDAVANYQYYERYTQTTGMLFGNTMTNGLNNNRIPNPNITWEKALYKNLGLDGTMLRQKLNFALDFYHRRNYDMLQTATSSVPTTLGVAIADQNYAEIKAWGVEGSIGYNGKITSDLSFNAQINVGWTDNKVIKKYFAAASDTGWKYPIGRRTDAGIEGYKATHIFKTKAEVDAFYAKNPGWLINGDSLRVGYLNFVDINGDGRITDLDKTRIAPRSGSLIGLGFNFGLAWRGLRFSVNTGLSIGGSRVYDNTARRPPTENQSALAFWKNSWSPENLDAKYPVINSPLISDVSDFWIVSGTTMRINNAQLSYTLPSKWSTKLKIPELRLFAVGTNLWTIINNQPYKDPASNVAVDYPALRTFTFGANLSF